MILDKEGRPFPEKTIGEQYWEAFARAERGSKLQAMRAVFLGWTTEQYQHYIDTGEEP